MDKIKELEAIYDKAYLECEKAFDIVHEKTGIRNNAYRELMSARDELNDK